MRQLRNKAIEQETISSPLRMAGRRWQGGDEAHSVGEVMYWKPW